MTAMNLSLPGSYAISDDPALLDLDAVHGFLVRSYWAKAIPRELAERSIRNSLCFGVYFDRKQIGFARVITDKATFAYLCDVFIAEEHRGRGLSKALVTAIKAHPELQGLRRWMLVTIDAQGLYEQFEFSKVAEPERHMEIIRHGIYEQQQQQQQQ
jgi:N-acetylglutamate synthase-like GNAT family acetyltransferase